MRSYSRMAAFLSRRYGGREPSPGVARSLHALLHESSANALTPRRWRNG